MCSGFVPVPLCGKRTRAGRPGEAGVAAGLRLPGWAEGALWLRKPPVCPAGLSSRGQRLPEAGETWLLRSQPRPTATGARPPTPTPLFLWVSSGSRSLFLSPSDLSAPLYIFIFALTPVTAGSWLQGWFMGWRLHTWCGFRDALILLGARNLLAVSLSVPPVAVCERLGKVSFTSIPS